MSRKQQTKRKVRAHDVDLSEALLRNGQAMVEGPKRRNWTRHDLKTIKPLTQNQEDMFHAFFAGKNICAHGTAGTGKTYIALFLALNEMLHPDTKIEKLIIVRSAVQTRDMGYMPGSLEEKIALYEAPYVDMFTDILHRKTSYNDMKDAGLVEFCTTSYVRGLTWDNAIVIVDEGQNMTFHEINSVMTRLGQDSRVIFVGDTEQSDLQDKKREQSGMKHFLAVVEKMSEFCTLHFTRDDIVRSAFVKSWIIACEENKG